MNNFRVQILVSFLVILASASSIRGRDWFGSLSKGLKENEANDNNTTELLTEFGDDEKQTTFEDSYNVEVTTVPMSDFNKRALPTPAPLANAITPPTTATTGGPSLKDTEWPAPSEPKMVTFKPMRQFYPDLRASANSINPHLGAEDDISKRDYVPLVPAGGQGPGPGSPPYPSHATEPTVGYPPVTSGVINYMGTNYYQPNYPGGPYQQQTPYNYQPQSQPGQMPGQPNVYNYYQPYVPGGGNFYSVPPNNNYSTSYGSVPGPSPYYGMPNNTYPGQPPNYGQSPSYGQPPNYGQPPIYGQPNITYPGQYGYGQPNNTMPGYYGPGNGTGNYVSYGPGPGTGYGYGYQQQPGNNLQAQPTTINKRFAFATTDFGQAPGVIYYGNSSGVSQQQQQQTPAPIQLPPNYTYNTSYGMPDYGQVYVQQQATTGQQTSGQAYAQPGQAYAQPGQVYTPPGQVYPSPGQSYNQTYSQNYGSAPGTPGSVPNYGPPVPGPIPGYGTPTPNYGYNQTYGQNSGQVSGQQYIPPSYNQTYGQMPTPYGQNYGQTYNQIPGGYLPIPYAQTNQTYGQQYQYQSSNGQGLGQQMMYQQPGYQQLGYQSGYQLPNYQQQNNQRYQYSTPTIAPISYANVSQYGVSPAQYSQYTSMLATLSSGGGGGYQPNYGGYKYPGPGMGPPMAASNMTVAVVSMKGSNGKVQGTIYLTEIFPQVVLINGFINGLDTGDHGLHIHEFGDMTQLCKSPGVHYNPTGENHGNINGIPSHVGDLGNVHTDVMSVTFVNKLSRRFTLVTGPYAVVGRALAVHERADDLGRGDSVDSLKNGNSGAKIGCGIIGLANISPTPLVSSGHKD